MTSTGPGGEGPTAGIRRGAPRGSPGSGGCPSAGPGGTWFGNADAAPCQAEPAGRKGFRLKGGNCAPEAGPRRGHSPMLLSDGNHACPLPGMRANAPTRTPTPRAALENPRTGAIGQPGSGWPSPLLRRSLNARAPPVPSAADLPTGPRREAPSRITGGFGPATNASLRSRDEANRQASDRPGPAIRSRGNAPLSKAASDDARATSQPASGSTKGCSSHIM
jgi:hypothetical protein